MELNPFLSVWTQPKETVRQFIDHDKLGFSVLVASISGIGGVITSLQNSGFFQDMSLFLWMIGILVAGIISGLISLGINSLLYTGIGKLYGGTGNLRNMAVAIGPMMIPQVFLLPVLVVYIIIYGQRFFDAPPQFSLTSIPLGAYLLLLLIIIIASFWSIVVSAKAIGVVHGFSSWRGFGVIMTIAGIGVFIGVLTIIVIIMFLF